MLQVQSLDLGSRPGRSSEKAQAGRQAGIVGETAYGNAAAHFRPADALDEFGQHHLQRDAVQRIVDLRCCHLPTSAYAAPVCVGSSLADGGRQG